MEIHIGSIIRQHCHNNFITPARLASLLSVSKDYVYKLFQRPTIQTLTLLKISKALRHDFFQYYQTALGLPAPFDAQKIQNLNRQLQKENEKLNIENQLLKKITKITT